jgi:hypothetical protein
MSLETAVNNQTVPMLKKMLENGNIEFARTAVKAVLVGLVLAHPAIVPREIWRPATPSLDEQQQLHAPATLAAIQSAVSASVSAALPTLVDGILGSVQTQLDYLRGEIAAQERNPGEPQRPRHTSIPTPPVGIDFDVVARHITADTLAKIVNNTFPIRNLYKIDRTRVDRVVEQVGTEMEQVVQERLKSALEKVGESKAKYKDLYSILRPWIVFVQLKEIFEPGMGIALTGHSNKLLRLGMRHPNRFPTLLNNHINVVKERLNAGASFHPYQNDWRRHERQMLLKLPGRPWRDCIPSPEDRLLSTSARSDSRRG